MTEKVKITAKDIKYLLSQKHSEDVFVEECKNGSTYYSTDLLKIDAWAMKKSWKNPLSIAYEIKINRNDFLNDTKWRNYLLYCNEFYFVCPHGLIDKSELPEESGLIYCSKTGNKLYTKKKSPHREIEIPEELLKYILFSRTIITREIEENSMAYWQDWLMNERYKKDLGMRVSKAIQKTVDDVKSQNIQLNNKNESLEIIKKVAEKLGIVPSKWLYEEDVERKFKSIKKIIPDTLISNIDKTIKDLTETKKKFEELNSE